MGRIVAGKILIVLHQEHSSPGRIGRFLIERGYELDIRRPRFDDPLPRTMDEHAGAVIFGGPMSVNDEEAWIRREIDWIGVPLGAGKPFLGICLGAQMLTRHLGGRVSRHREGTVEIGYWPIEPTSEGRTLMPWPSHVYHWHNEGSEHVRGTRLLATGKTFGNQAFGYGRAAYGLQFHPEVTYLMMNRWTTGNEESFKLPGAQAREQQFIDRWRYDPGLQQWLHGFLDLWLQPQMAMAAE